MRFMNTFTFLYIRVNKIISASESQLGNKTTILPNIINYIPIACSAVIIMLYYKL